MRTAVVLVVALTLGHFGADARAASYRKIDGTIVDPILDRQGNVHAYSGPDLAPGMPSAPGPSGQLANADLPNADLRGASLAQFNFEDTNLAGTDLSGADLRRVRFDRSILAGSNLASAALYGAEMNLADLSGANLSGADLSRAVLDLANVAGATFANAYYDANTIFPTGFDPIDSGMFSGPTLVNNGLAPPAPTNVFNNPERDLTIRNVGCNAFIEWPCPLPGAATLVGGSVKGVSVFETSSFSGTVDDIIVLHDSSTADALIGGIDASGAWASGNSSLIVNGLQGNDLSLTARDDSLVWAGGGAWGDVDAFDRAQVILFGNEAQGATFSVHDDALLEVSTSFYWLRVNGGRAILHAGEAYIGVDVAPGGVLENLGGRLEGSYSPYNGNAIHIGGKLEMSGGSIGPVELLVDGYASISGGQVYAVAIENSEPGFAGPWNFSATDSGLIHVEGGIFGDRDGAGSDSLPSHLGARDSSRIRIFGSGFSIAGQAIPSGSLTPSEGTLVGTLSAGDPFDNPFAHRGADCGGHPCTGRILVLAAGLDWDQDAIPNPFDNCAEEPNADQADLDLNGTGDVCFAPVDLDQDNVVDALDNCRMDENPDQADTDSDGVGDACDDSLVVWTDPGTNGCTAPPQLAPYTAVTSDLANGDWIDRGAQPCDCMGLELPVEPGVASVRFLHVSPTGVVKEICENAAPFAFGLAPAQPLCSTSLAQDGAHAIMVTPYDAPGCAAGSGAAMASSIRRFEVPEPGIAAMIGAGCIGLLGLARRSVRSRDASRRA